MKIGILCNCHNNYTLQDNEPKDKYYDMDSCDTIKNIENAFNKEHDVDVIEANHDAYTKLREKKYDMVFNFSEGIDGTHRELYFPSIMEMLHVPFTGSSSLTMGICFDKVQTKKTLLYHKIPTPKYVIMENMDEFALNGLNLPVIIKPNHEGSSIGITSENIVYDKAILREKARKIVEVYKQPALIEEFLGGREFTVCVIGNKHPEVLPIVEVKDKKEDAAAWVWDKSERSTNYFDCPTLAPELETEIKKIAIRAYKALGCRDWARIDFRCDKENKPYVIEINGIAGLSDHSAFPFSAKAAGMSFDDLLNKILKHAIERHKNGTH